MKNFCFEPDYRGLERITLQNQDIKDENAIFVAWTLESLDFPLQVKQIAINWIEIYAF